MKTNMEENKAQESSLYDFLKKKHPDSLLLFRTGDFYEAYKEDAYTVSKILDIPVVDERMVRFQCFALDEYLPKLIKAGNRIAICDKID